MSAAGLSTGALHLDQTHGRGRIGKIAARLPSKPQPRSKVIRQDLDALVSRVRAAFPDLAFAKAEIEDRGGDHRVLLLDREYVFRFPRRPDNNLRMEIAVLAELEGKCEML